MTCKRRGRIGIRRGCKAICFGTSANGCPVATCHSCSILLMNAKSSSCRDCCLDRQSCTRGAEDKHLIGRVDNNACRMQIQNACELLLQEADDTE